jgi:hypothetical protein
MSPEEQELTDIAGLLKAMREDYPDVKVSTKCAMTAGRARGRPGRRYTVS